MNGHLKDQKVPSHYLAKNATIWLADEVLRYRDHDTSTHTAHIDKGPNQVKKE